ncbi:hypothetical protein K501DRAFT_287837 [Backusella circina FSU 941]|nr:hypothetical protein K501DRAFT_287837 [Backusella circina FSU 941]
MNLTVEFPGSSFKTLSIFLDGLYSFGDELRIDARRAQFIMSTRNLSLTGQAVIRLSPLFFDKYILALEQDQSLRGRLLSKKLRMVFRKNLANVASLTKCTIHIDDRSTQEGTEYSQINLGLEYQNRVKKKHALWFSESDDIDQLYPQTSPYEFNANPNLFSSYTAFFNNHEIAEIVLECTPTSVTMRSYSGIMSTSKGSNPLETTIQINSSDFQRYSVQSNVTMVFNLKEFKSVLSFMEAIQAPLFARFEEPGKPIVFFYKDSNVIAEFALSTTEYDVDMLQGEYNSISMSMVSGATPPTNHNRRHATSNNRSASPIIRVEDTNDTEPEPDTENVRRLAQRQASYDSDSSASGPSTKRPASSHREPFKRLKQERPRRQIQTSSQESSQSLIMVGPEFEQMSPDQPLSFSSPNIGFPFESSSSRQNGRRGNSNSNNNKY